jgi:hypothetical protein
MDTTLKLTRQGIRDLNSYGPRPKPVAADDAAPAEAAGLAVVEARESEAVDSTSMSTSTTVVSGGAVVASPESGSS